MCTALQLGGDVEQPWQAWLMSNYDVIHKTGSTEHITMPQEKDQAAAIGNRHRTFVEDRTCSSKDMIADRQTRTQTDTRTHTHPFNCPLSALYIRVSRYQKGKTNLDFTEARDSEWQWHQLGHASQHLAPDR